MGQPRAADALVDLRVVEEEHRLLKLRNPHGDSSKYEWGGAWSHGAPEWTEERKSALGEAGPKSNGTFWMELGDFWRFFDSVYVCHTLSARDGWHEQLIDGEWSAAHAGGGPGQERWCVNPLYALLPSNKATRLRISISNPSLPRHAYLKQDRIGITLGPMGRRPFDPAISCSASLESPAMASFTVDRDILWQEDDVASPTGGQPLFLIPSTVEPGRHGRFRLSVRSDSAVQIVNLTGRRGDDLIELCRERWRAHGGEVALAGAWVGKAAGGLQADSMASWLANPQFLLSVYQPMQVLIGVECADELRLGPPRKRPKDTDGAAALMVGVDICVGTSKKTRASTGRVTDANSEGYELLDQFESFDASVRRHISKCTPACASSYKTLDSASRADTLHVHCACACAVGRGLERCFAQTV